MRLINSLSPGDHRPVRTGLLVVLWTLALIANAAAAGSGVPGDTARLWGGHWALRTWGYRSEGFFGWIKSGTDVRLEILESSCPSTSDVDGLQRLWRQDGEGWTLIAGSGGGGTINRWGREWRPLDPVQQGLLLQVAEKLPRLLAAGNPGERSVSFILPPAPRPGMTPAFRENLVVRGLGQGGLGQIITLAEKVPGAAAAGELLVNLTSSRRPGVVSLYICWQGVPGGEVPLEVFAPLWPLGDFLKFPGPEPELEDPAGVEESTVHHGG